MIANCSRLSRKKGERREREEFFSFWYILLLLKKKHNLRDIRYLLFSQTTSSSEWKYFRDLCDQYWSYFCRSFRCFISVEEIKVSTSTKEWLARRKWPHFSLRIDYISVSWILPNEFPLFSQAQHPSAVESISRDIINFARIGSFVFQYWVFNDVLWKKRERNFTFTEISLLDLRHCDSDDDSNLFCPAHKKESESIALSEKFYFWKWLINAPAKKLSTHKNCSPVGIEYSSRDKEFLPHLLSSVLRLLCYFLWKVRFTHIARIQSRDGKKDPSHFFCYQHGKCV